MRAARRLRSHRERVRGAQETEEGPTAQLGARTRAAARRELPALRLGLVGLPYQAEFGSELAKAAAGRGLSEARKSSRRHRARARRADRRIDGTRVTAGAAVGRIGRRVHALAAA